MYKIHKMLFGLVLLLGLCYAGVEAGQPKPMVAGDIIQLPQPLLKGTMSLEEALLRRRSMRSFRQEPVSLQQISQLLWAGQGISKKDPVHSFRTAPSAGALYPLTLYAATPDGFFEYMPESHQLLTLQKRDIRAELAQAALGQVWVRQAPLVIVICASYERVTSHYGRRGLRYTDMEAGHSAQNIHLQAVALSLDSVGVGAFDSAELKKIIQAPEGQEPLYIIPVGLASK